MADNNNSSVVAIFAIVLIALLAFAGYYLFMRQPTETVNVEMPAATSTSAPAATSTSAPAPANQ